MALPPDFHDPLPSIPVPPLNEEAESSATESSFWKDVFHPDKKWIELQADGSYSIIDKPALKNRIFKSWMHSNQLLRNVRNYLQEKITQYESSGRHSAEEIQELNVNISQFNERIIKHNDMFLIQHMPQFLSKYFPNLRTIDPLQALELPQTLEDQLTQDEVEQLALAGAVDKALPEVINEELSDEEVAQLALAGAFDEQGPSKTEFSEELTAIARQEAKEFVDTVYEKQNALLEEQHKIRQNVVTNQVLEWLGHDKALSPQDSERYQKTIESFIKIPSIQLNNEGHRIIKGLPRDLDSLPTILKNHIMKLAYEQDQHVHRQRQAETPLLEIDYEKMLKEQEHFALVRTGKREELKPESVPAEPQPDFQKIEGATQQRALISDFIPENDQIQSTAHISAPSPMREAKVRLNMEEFSEAEQRLLAQHAEALEICEILFREERDQLDNEYKMALRILSKE